MHFAELMQICGAHAQANGANLEWANILPVERETLRGALDRLNKGQWLAADSRLRWDSTPPLQSEVLPVLEETPES